MPYAVPSAIGGTLIRKVISSFRDHQASLPLTGKLLIATSAGVDSMVLAHLMGRYGRRLALPEQITLLHFDHGWRPESATREKNLVQALAESLGVQFLHVKLEPPLSAAKGINLEDDARQKRNAAYTQLCANGETQVLTAHHRDDVAESLMWRFFRGELFEMNQGILFQDGAVIRPFLQISKEEIRQYAKSESVSFLEDPSNEDQNQFRSWMRHQVFPLLEQQFPQLKQTLFGYLKRNAFTREGRAFSAAISAATGHPLRRSHLESIDALIHRQKPDERISLPGGYQLRSISGGFVIEKAESPQKSSR